MTRVQHLLPFVSIIVGLGVTGLLKEIYFLFKDRKQVQWHWIPLVWAISAFLLLINSWYEFERTLNYDLTSNAIGFAISILPLILKYAFSTSVLPDLSKSSTIDLKQYYFDEKNLMFSIFVLHLISVILVEYFGAGTLNSLLRNGIAATLIGALIFTKNKYYHGVITIAFLVGLIVRMSQQYSG